MIRMSAVMRLKAIASASIYMQLNVTGATTWVGGPPSPGPGSDFGNTYGLYVGSSTERLDNHDSMVFTARFNAGTTNVEAQYMTIGSASPRAIIAPSVEVTPLRFA
jgi:hypothetical protein